MAVVRTSTNGAACAFRLGSKTAAPQVQEQQFAPLSGARLRRRAVVMASDVGAVRHGIGWHRRSIARMERGVTVRVKVTAARRCEVMPGAERAVRHEGKRRHDRQSGRKRLHSNWA